MSTVLVENPVTSRDSLHRFGGMVGASDVRAPGKRGDATTKNAVRPDLMERVALLCSSPLFAGLGERVCLEAAACALVRAYARDEVLFSQGEPVRALILLQDGSVKHTQVSAGGNEALLRISAPGDMVSIRGESRSCTHTCSARAIEKCRALVWEFELIQRFLGKSPQLGININRVLAAQLQELEERFREIATENVARRVALLLLRLHRRIGKPCREGIQIALSREELAKMTGATVFTISRLLSKWSRMGFVHAQREMVIVSDSNRLALLDQSEEPEISDEEGRIAGTRA